MESLSDTDPEAARSPELEAALGPVLQALRRLGIRHYVGGSIASSAHGFARSSVDADVIAELGSEHVEPLGRRGGETSERQWGDVLGVLRASGPALDHAYLEEFARQLGVADLLERALTKAGEPS